MINPPLVFPIVKSTMDMDTYEEKIDEDPFHYLLMNDQKKGFRYNMCYAQNAYMLHALVSLMLSLFAHLFHLNMILRTQVQA